MASDHKEPFDPPPQPLSLRRWSQRKLEAARSPSSVVAVQANTTATARDVAPISSISATTSPALPPVESLTFDSEFAPFLGPKVDELVKRAALKQLFRDPRFNVMDGLDVYIEDYNKADPIPPDMLSKLAHSRYIFDPPQTELTTRGHVIDKPLSNPLALAAPPTAPPGSADATGGEMVPTPVPVAVDTDVTNDAAAEHADAAKA